MIVTAQKREQNIQDVGISITTFSGDQSRQFHIRGVTQKDFADYTESPNYCMSRRSMSVY